MLAGERIVRVEHAYTENVSPNVVADLLRGPENTYVSLTVINKNNESRELSVQRRRVEVPCVENVRFVNVDQRVGYMRLTTSRKPQPGTSNVHFTIFTSKA